MDAPGPPSRSRLWRLATSRLGRVGALVVVAYVAAALGIGLGFLRNAGRPTDAATAVSIALLFVSFLAMFQASRTLLGTEREE